MRKLGIILLASGLVLLAVVFGGRDSLISAGAAEAAPQTTTVYWGNFTVAGFSDLTNFYFNMAKPCSDCYITGAIPDLEFDSGGGNWVSSNFANGAMLHHFVIFNDARPDTTCGPIFTPVGLGDRFYASGNERTVMDLPDGYGYYIPASSSSTQWDINLHIHNVGSQTRAYRVAVTFTWQPASDNLRDLTSIWLDENNCSTSIYPVPAGYDDRHWDWTSNTEGRVITIGGHVHDFGLSVSVEKVSTGQWLCASNAGYASGSAFDPAAVASPPRPNNAGHPSDAASISPGDPSYVGHIEDMSVCAPNAVIAVGDATRLHSQYNATAPIDDVMGIMNLMVYDNCASLTNPDQADFDNDLMGDACDPDIDGDTIANGSDPEADGDLISNTTETACGSDPNNSLKRPERVDGAFAGVSDDGDAQVDEALPGGASGQDCDGDGYPGTAETNVFPSVMLRDQDPCGMTAWPADFVAGGIPNSTNKVTITDLTSFLAPERRINTSPGDTAFDIRWDIVPGPGLFSKVININDMTSLITVMPPMFNGPRAFNGPTCPWP